MMEPTNIPPVPSSPAWPIMLMPRKLTVSEERREDSRLECKGVEGCEHEWVGGGGGGRGGGGGGEGKEINLLIHVPNNNMHRGIVCGMWHVCGVVCGCTSSNYCTST